MKQEIMEKIINNEELSKDDVLFIAKNLHDDNKVPLPYDHSVTSTVEACGITKKDADEMNDVFKNIITSNDIKSVSEVVQAVETLVHQDERYMRMVIVQCVAAAKDYQTDPIIRMLRELRRKGGPLGGGKSEEKE